MSSLHETEVRLLLALATFAEKHERPMASYDLFGVSGLEYAEFARRIVFLAELGLVRVERARPLAEDYQCVVLTRRGTLRVIAERVAVRVLPSPGVRSRLSPLALEAPDVTGSSSSRTKEANGARGRAPRQRPRRARRAADHR